MYSQILHKLIEWASSFIDWCINAFTWPFAPKRLAVICLIIAAIGVSAEYGPSLPGCGGPVLPTPTVRPTVAPPTATATAPEPTPGPTPGPTPTMPESPASPLQTPGAGW